MAGFKSWGIMADWDQHWKTMDPDFELAQLSVFRELTRKGLIYRREKPVYWSPSSGSALAEAELEYHDDHVSTAALVKFPLVRHPFGDVGIDGEEEVSAVIWTTTPWTLPANQAIAIQDDMEYLLARSPSHGVLLLAKSRMDFVAKMIEEDLDEVVSTIRGSELLRRLPRYRSLFGSDDSDRPLLHADFVKSDAGTGLVHCAPGHGHDDHQTLLPYIENGEIKLVAPVDASGRFTSDASPEDPQLLEGKDVLTEGNAAVLDVLSKQEKLLHSYPYTHTSPYDWRTKQPVIVRATPQWFADVSSIRGDAIRCLDEVGFVPPSGKGRLTSFVANRSEWCISRQRAWGIPIPALYNVNSGEAILDPPSIDHIIATIRERGINAWWTDAEDDPAWVAPTLRTDDLAGQYRRGTDTMDVWFDSGTSWSRMLDGNQSPGKPLADLYLEGSDQHRGWFQSSLLTRVGYQSSSEAKTRVAAPFRSVITHGFTLDEQARKMSKSEGNVIRPEEIIQGLAETNVVPKKGRMGGLKKLFGRARRRSASLGPDALRMWVASSDFTKDVVVSDNIIKTVHAALHKYRVTLKFLLGALTGFDPAQCIPYHNLSQMDHIALHQVWQMDKTVKTAYNDYEIHQAVREINRWVNTDFSGLYVEAIKDVLYCDQTDSPRRRAIQTTLYHIWTQLQVVLAPVVPLLVEESWQHAPNLIKNGSEEVATHPLMRTWAGYTPPAEWLNPAIEDLLPTLMAVNKAVKAAQERARADKKMGSSLDSFVSLLVPDPDADADMNTNTTDTDTGRSSDAASLLRPGREISLSTLRQLLVVSDVCVKVGGRHHGDNQKDGHSHRHGEEEERERKGPGDSEEHQQPHVTGWSYSEPIELVPPPANTNTNTKTTTTTTTTVSATANGVAFPPKQILGTAIVHQPTSSKCARCWTYRASGQAYQQDDLLVVDDSGRGLDNNNNNNNNNHVFSSSSSSTNSSDSSSSSSLFSTTTTTTTQEQQRQKGKGKGEREKKPQQNQNQKHQNQEKENKEEEEELLCIRCQKMMSSYDH